MQVCHDMSRDRYVGASGAPLELSYGVNERTICSFRQKSLIIGEVFVLVFKSVSGSRNNEQFPLAF